MNNTCHTLSSARIEAGGGVCMSLQASRYRGHEILRSQRHCHCQHNCSLCAAIVRTPEMINSFHFRSPSPPHTIELAFLPRKNKIYIKNSLNYNRLTEFKRCFLHRFAVTRGVKISSTSRGCCISLERKSTFFRQFYRETEQFIE